jgi:hypothetical protein
MGFAMGILGFLLILGGCKDIRTVTRIYSGGSCERTIVVVSDTTDFEEVTYPLPIENDWTIQTEEVEEEGKIRYQRTYKKRFSKVSRLNAELERSGEELILPISVRLKKRFRWFSTFYEYHESYQSFFPFHSLPMEVYLTEEEIRLYHEGSDTTGVHKINPDADEDDLEVYRAPPDSIEDKIEDWANRNVFEVFFQELIHGAQRLDEPGLTKEIIETHKEKLYQTVFQMDTDLDDENVIPEILRVSSEILGTDLVNQLRPEITEAVDEIRIKMDYVEETASNSYENQVIMPGLVMDTNADEIEGNRLSWSIDPDAFMHKDYEMWAESRIVNRWAVWVTGGILLMVLGILIVLTVRGRRG